MTVVSELLKSGYKKIDVKNTTGQTALHIACTKGYKEITEMLIEHQANVEVRDEEGVTPLHVSPRVWRFISDALLCLSAPCWWKGKVAVVVKVVECILLQTLVLCFCFDLYTVAV